MTRNQRIIADYCRGDKRRDIAARYGVTVHIVDHVLDDYGVQRRLSYPARRHHAHCDELRAKVEGAYGKKSASVVAKEVGLTRCAVIGVWFRGRRAGRIPANA